MKRICLFLLGPILIIATLTPLPGYCATLTQQIELESHFPYPIAKVLIKAGIDSLEDLAKLTERQVSRLEGIGPLYYKCIKDTLAKNGLSLGPQGLTERPLLDRSPDSLDLPLPFLHTLAAKGITSVGQLLLLSAQDIARMTGKSTVERVKAVMASLDLELGTPHPKYDVPIETIFTRPYGLKFKEYGLNSLKELAVLTEEEFEEIVSQGAKNPNFAAVRAALQEKQVALGAFPFLDLPLKDRLRLYRSGVHTPQQVDQEQLCGDLVSGD